MGLSFSGANLGPTVSWSRPLISWHPVNSGNIDGAKLPTSQILAATAHGSGNIDGAKLSGRQFGPDLVLAPPADLLATR